MKKARPESHISVYERNRADDTFGFGVVFSDATLGGFAEADPESYATITQRFAHWDDIEVHWKGEVVRSRGHGFAGLARAELLAILQARAVELGVELFFEHELPNLEALPPADLVVIADGVNSAFRSALAADFQPTLDWRPNRFVWLGTDAALRGVHVLLQRERSTGCSRCTPIATSRKALHLHRRVLRQRTFQRAGLDKADEDETVAFCEQPLRQGAPRPPLLQPLDLAAVPHVVSNERWHSATRSSWATRPHGALLHRLGHQARHGGRHRAGRGGAQVRDRSRTRWPPTNRPRVARGRRRSSARPR
jgi:anthraniloyl-CoA monooxygenase